MRKENTVHFPNNAWVLQCTTLVSFVCLFACFTKTTSVVESYNFVVVVRDVLVSDTEDTSDVFRVAK